MVELTGDDLGVLLRMLRTVPELGSESGRQMILSLAGLSNMTGGIDLSGAADRANWNIVKKLTDFGRVSFDREALGLFLGTVKDFVGIEQQGIIDGLLQKYQMLVPAKASPAITDWPGGGAGATVLEKVYGENTLRPIAFLEQGLRVARAVGYISVHAGSRRWSATGFLIGPDLFITNNHVLPESNMLAGVLVRFNYAETFEGKARKCREYRPAENALFYTSTPLDYTVMQLAGSPGRLWKWLSLRPQPVERDERVNIIQHPNGQPKQISFQNNFVEYASESIIGYVTPTLPGSSGSPVFNDNWEVVALHHAAGSLREPGKQHTYFCNQGIPIGKILEDLPAQVRDRIAT